MVTVDLNHELVLSERIYVPNLAAELTMGYASIYMISFNIRSSRGKAVSFGRS